MKYESTIQTKNAVDFMVACFDDFTLEELESIDVTDPDYIDCKTWHINPDQWVWSLATALILKKQSTLGYSEIDPENYITNVEEQE